MCIKKETNLAMSSVDVRIEDMKGIQTTTSGFEEFIREDDVYVDKTKYVYSLVGPKQRGRFFFISRPRRFGKSLMCSTLKELFLGKKELFKDLSIGKSDYDFRKYPVLDFNFAVFDTYTAENFLGSYNLQLRFLAEDNGVTLSEGSPHDRFRELIRTLGEVVIIIDEFDYPLIDCLKDREKADKIRSILSGFFTVIKNESARVRFFFMTGVTRLSNISIFSKLNNLEDISFREEYAGMFGFTEEEMRSNFEEHIDEYLSANMEKWGTKENFLSEVKNYYDGYRFSTESDVQVYNPISISKFFNDKKCVFRNYWWETGGKSTLAINLARKYDLINVLDGDTTIDLDAVSAFNIEALANEEISRKEAVALLFTTGYLTIAGGDDCLASLSFPNKEVSTSFVRSLVDLYIDCDQKDAFFYGYDAKKAASGGDAEEIITLLRQFYATFSYQLLNYDSMEKSFQLIFHAFFALAGFNPKSEESSMLGRADCVLESGDHVYIAELKVDKSAESAIRQMRENRYYEKYVSSGKHIHLLGISFSSEERTIKEYIAEDL